MKIEAVITSSLNLGEGPHWDEKTKSLYFVDMSKEYSTINKYDPELRSHTFIKVGDRSVSFIITTENKSDQFLISYGADLATLIWDDKQNKITDFQIIQNIEAENLKLRLNDGKVSPSGVLFAGTMGSEIIDVPYRFGNKGSLYAYQKNNLKKLVTNIDIANGLAWTSDEKVFYYIDTPTCKIDAFSYDSGNISLSNKRTVFDLHKNNIPGFPDGMTIDQEGNLWIACYESGRVIKINPETGKLLQSIDFPCSYITSVTFGGSTLEELYVTSGQGPLFKVTEVGSVGTSNVAYKL